MAGKYKCPVCERYDFDEYGSFDFCKVCGWCNDPLERNSQAYKNGFNGMTVEKYREEWINNSPWCYVPWINETEGPKMKKLRKLLMEVPDTYRNFVYAIYTDCEYYKDKNTQICEQLLDFFETHPNANSSDVIEYESYIIGIPYGDESGKWYRWGKEITEEEAQLIVDTEYSE